MIQRWRSCPHARTRLTKPTDSCHLICRPQAGDSRVAGVLPERLRAHSGDQHVERAPCVTEVPVMIFRRRMDLEPSGMVRDACCNAYELASKTLAVGASVCLVMSGQRLEP